MNNLEPRKKTHARASTGSNALLIALAYFISRILGLVRDRLLVSHFGIGAYTDAYTAAFRIPDLLFTLLISGAFAVAFIPVITEHWVKDEQAEAWKLSNDVLNVALLATLALTILAIIFSDPLVRLTTIGFDPARHQLTVNLTRILLISPILFVVSGIWGSIAQAFNRFLYFSFSGIFYNTGIIIGILMLSGRYSIYGVAYGVVLGAAAQALIQLFGLMGLGYHYLPSFDLRNPSLHKVLKLMIPRSIDQGVDQINYTFQTIIGSQLATGSLTAYYYANNLKNVPLVLFGSAIATAVFPTLSAQAAESRTDKLIETFVHNFRLILFFIIPSAIAAVILRGYIVRLLFGFGNAMTASTLGWFSGAIVFTSLFLLISRVYYALQDTRTPLYLSIFAISLNIVLSFILGHRYGIGGLAMAQSMVAIIETIILFALLRRKLPSLGLATIYSGLWRMLLSGSISASCMYLAATQLLPLYGSDRGLFVVGPKFGVIITIGIVGYLLPCYILQLREAKIFASRFVKQIMRPLNILNQQNQ